MPSGTLGTHCTNRTSINNIFIVTSLHNCGLAFLVLGNPSCVEVFCLRFCLPVHGFLDGGTSILTVNRRFYRNFWF